MTVSEFIYKKLNDIAKTVPVTAPIESGLPLITYSIDGQETTPVISGSDIVQNYTTITAYAEEYDEAMSMASEIIANMNCSQGEPNIFGVTYASMSNGFDGEPTARYNVALEFNIYERG